MKTIFWMTTIMSTVVEMMTMIEMATSGVMTGGGGMARLNSARPSEANLAATKRCVFSRLTEDFRSTSQLNNDLSHFDLHPTPALMR